MNTYKNIYLELRNVSIIFRLRNLNTERDEGIPQDGRVLFEFLVTGGNYQHLLDL